MVLNKKFCENKLCKPMQLLKTILLAIVITCQLSACNNDSSNSAETESASSTVTVTSLASGPTYYQDIKSIIDTKCVTCHRDGGDAPFSLTSFRAVSAVKSAIAYAIDVGAMPKAGFEPLTSAEKVLLQTWLSASSLLEGTPAAEGVSDFNYWAHVKNIIDNKCANCHIEGGIAPFPLTNYRETHAIRAAIEYALKNDSMPPWPPTDGYSPMKYPMSLSKEDKHVLLDWAANGAPEGESANYSAVVYPSDKPAVNYDIAIQIPQPYLPTGFPDDYRCFVIEWPLTEKRYITASNFYPDKAKQVHHVFMSVIDPSKADIYHAADGADGKPGYTCYGSPAAPNDPTQGLGLRGFGQWVPGAGATVLPESTGIAIEPGSLLAIQMHYNTGVVEPEPDQSTFKIATTANVERQAAEGYLLNFKWPGGDMLIPAGESKVDHYGTIIAAELAAFFAPDQIDSTKPYSVHRVGFHMHSLGVTGHVKLKRADGTVQTLLDIEHWDFNWQGVWDLKSEVVVQPEDTFEVLCSYNNSAAFQANRGAAVATAPKDVNWGESTSDEMCVSTLYLTPTKTDYVQSTASPTLTIDTSVYKQSFAPGDVVPLKLYINNFELVAPAEESMDITPEGTPNKGYYTVTLNNVSTTSLIGWDSQAYFVLPDNIADGIQSLTVSLRTEDNDHVAVEGVAVEDSIDIIVDSDQSSATTPLIDNSLWTVQNAAKDSLASHRPSEIDCPTTSSSVEEGAVEIETGACNYYSVVQPLLADIKADDQLHLVLWHSQLRYDEPASAHVAMTVAGHRVWETEVSIPNSGQIFDITVDAGFSASAGAEVEFHLHNHGNNAWKLLSFEK